MFFTYCSYTTAFVLLIGLLAKSGRYSRRPFCPAADLAFYYRKRKKQHGPYQRVWCIGLKMRLRHRLLFLLILLTISSPAVGGNSRAFMLADEAAMTGGAGVAVSRDSGSLWYNPAGLGGLTLERMELTGTVYSLKIRKLDGLLETRLPSGTHEKDGTSGDYESVPTSLVFVRNANEKLSYGFALYQTNSSNVDYRLSLKVPFDAGGATWSEGIEYHQRASISHLGPAFGVALTPRLRVGCALYLVMMNAMVSLRGFAGVEDESDDALNSLVSVSSHASIMKLGLTVTGGLQWEFRRRWHIGLVVRTPTFQLYESQDISSLDSEAVVSGSNGALNYDYIVDDKRGLGFTQISPLEVQLGLVYKKDESWIGIEGAVRPPLDKQDMGLLWNAGIGGRLQVSELFSWGAGVFTDRSSTKLSEQILDWQSDRYGITTGVEFKTPVLVKKTIESKKVEAKKAASKKSGAAIAPPKKDEAASELRKLVWATTVAFSYSFELAEYNSLYIDATNGMEIDAKRKSGVFHQPTIYLGTALYF